MCGICSILATAAVKSAHHYLDQKVNKYIKKKYTYELCTGVCINIYLAVDSG